MTPEEIKLRRLAGHHLLQRTDTQTAVKDLCGVQAAAGSACASSSIQPSHVLTAMGLTAKEANECVRFSLGKHTTEGEILCAANIVKETVEKLRAGK